MAETVSVTNEDDFVAQIVNVDDLSMTSDGARECWSLWTDRYENGAENDVLVALPDWFSQKEFDAHRPYFFAKIEHDDPSSGAILFSDARQIDINIIENGVWDKVTMTEALDVLDISETNEYIDESGKVWCPRSVITIFERFDEIDETPYEAESGGLVDTASSGIDDDD